MGPKVVISSDTLLFKCPNFCCQPPFALRSSEFLPPEQFGGFRNGSAHGTAPSCRWRGLHFVHQAACSNFPREIASSPSDLRLAYIGDSISTYWVIRSWSISMLLVAWWFPFSPAKFETLVQGVYVGCSLRAAYHKFGNMFDEVCHAWKVEL